MAACVRRGVTVVRTTHAAKSAAAIHLRELNKHTRERDHRGDETHPTCDDGWALFVRQHVEVQADDSEHGHDGV